MSIGLQANRETFSTVAYMQLLTEHYIPNLQLNQLNLLPVLVKFFVDKTGVTTKNATNK